jgi:hypothetical protein
MCNEEYKARIKKEARKEGARMAENKAELLAENLECLHMCLDDQGIPREDDGKQQGHEKGKFSEWGRVKLYGEKIRKEGYEAGLEEAAGLCLDASTATQRCIDEAVRKMLPGTEALHTAAAATRELYNRIRALATKPPAGEEG